MRVIYKSSPKLRKAIIKELPNDAVRCFGECSHNVIKGNVKLGRSQKRQLSRYKNQLRRLASKATSIPEKRRVLTQNGGLPLALLAPIISIAGSLLLDALRK